MDNNNNNNPMKLEDIITADELKASMDEKVANNSEEAMAMKAEFKTSDKYSQEIRKMLTEYVKDRAPLIYMSMMAKGPEDVVIAFMCALISSIDMAIAAKVEKDQLEKLASL